MALFSSIPAIKNLKNLRSKKAEVPQKNYEYKDFAAYKRAGGVAATISEWKRGDGKWLRSDRESCNQFWKNAVTSIIKSPVAMQGRLTPFEQVADFYHYTQVLVLLHKHQTQWLFGAYYLVSDLADAYDQGATLDMWEKLFPDTYTKLGFKNLKDLLAALNVAIANYAISQFFRLIYGQYSNLPRKGIDAWKFDKQFIITEQNPTAYPVYDDPRYKDGIALENDIFNKKGIFVGYDALAIGNYIPVFPDQYNSNLIIDSDSEPRYGEEARILVPLAMLYPNKFFYTDTIDELPNSFAIKDRKFAKTMESGSLSVAKYLYPDIDGVIFRFYDVTNKNIKKVFYE